MPARETWLSRWPVRWRAAALALSCARVWRTTALVVLATAVVGVVVARQHEGFANVLIVYGPPLLAITIFAGLREHLTRGAVWTALFQRPVVEVHELVRILTLCAALYLVGAGLLQGGALTGLATGDVVAPDGIGYTVLTAVLWSVVVLFAAAAVSTLAAQGTAAMVIAWLLSPVILAMLAQAVELPGFARHTVEFLLPPLDAVFGYDEVLRGERPDDAVRYTTQLLTFPLLCAALIRWRFRAWVRADIAL